MAKSREKIIARKLRSKGKSIKNIAKNLKVSVSSVSAWCRDIELTQQQIEKLQNQAKDPFYGRRWDYILSRRRELEDKIQTLRKKGIEEIGRVTQRELFLIGVSLYWSEGFKKDSQAGFANSNPEMIKLFIKWLNTCGYTRNDLLIRVIANSSHKGRIKEIEKYWSQITGVPVTNFRKPFFQHVEWKKVYENSNEYFGVLRIKVRKSKDFLRKIHGWIEGLSLQA